MAPAALVTRSYRSLMKLCRRYLDDDVAWRSLVSSARYPGLAVDEAIPKGRVKLAEKIEKANGGALWFLPQIDGHVQKVTEVVREQYRAGKPEDLAIGFAALSYAAQVKAYATENIAPDLPAAAPGAEALASRQLTSYDVFSETESSASTWRKHLSSPDNALLLVAHPLLSAEPFQHTVIVMTSVYPTVGMDGVIVNMLNSPRVAYGGPVRETIRQDFARDSWIEALSEEDKAKLVERESMGGGISRIRAADNEPVTQVGNGDLVHIFGGSGWFAHQLRTELAEGTWLLAETTADFSEILRSNGPLAQLDRQAFYTQVLLHMESENDAVRQLARIRYADCCGIACIA